MLLLPNIDLVDVRGWAKRLAAMEAADDFDGRDFYIAEARSVIGLQREANLIPNTPENSPTEADPAPSGPDVA